MKFRPGAQTLFFFSNLFSGHAQIQYSPGQTLQTNDYRENRIEWYRIQFFIRVTELKLV